MLWVYSCGTVPGVGVADVEGVQLWYLVQELLVLWVYCCVLPGVGVADVVGVQLELPVAAPAHGDLMLPHLLVHIVELVLENQLTR